MSKYFANCKNLKELRKTYLSLMHEYHPDLIQDEKEIEKRNTICAKINAEYDMLSNILPKEANIDCDIDKSIYSEIISGSERARKACDDIKNKLNKPDLDYKYYLSLEGVIWWEEIILNEIDATIKLFWEICYAKGIKGEQFAKLYELCEFNTEKMRRVVMFLGTGALAEQDIHANLSSSNAIPIFNDNIIVEGLPDYKSLLLLSKKNTKTETLSAWIEFCQRQRDDFLDRYSEIVVPKISNECKKSK